MSDGGAPGGPPAREGGDADEASARQAGRGGRRGRRGRGRGGRGGRPPRGARNEHPPAAASETTSAPTSAPKARDGRPAVEPARDGQAPRPAGHGASRNGAGAGARREVSAGGVVYRVVTDATGLAQPHFLLIRDSYRNWGFPKGHLERGELPDAAAVREVTEETGLGAVELRGVIETIDWYFRFRGRLIHKICHFYLMQTERSETSPQVAEGITACRWAPFDEAVRLVSYANAREVLKRAHVMVSGRAAIEATPAADSSTPQPADE